MKKLNKLQINSDKLISQEELKSLKGGSCDYWCCVGEGTYPNWNVFFCGVGCGESQMGAEIDCNNHYNPFGFICKCY